MHSGHRTTGTLAVFATARSCGTPSLSSYQWMQPLRSPVQIQKYRSRLLEKMRFSRSLQLGQMYSLSLTVDLQFLRKKEAKQIAREDQCANTVGILCECCGFEGWKSWFRSLAPKASGITPDSSSLGSGIEQPHAVVPLAHGGRPSSTRRCACFGDRVCCVPPFRGVGVPSSGSGFRGAAEGRIRRIQPCAECRPGTPRARPLSFARGERWKRSVIRAAAVPAGSAGRSSVPSGVAGQARHPAAT